MKLITFNGKTQSISAWAEEVGLDKSIISKRLLNNWSIEDALKHYKKISRKPEEIIGQKFGFLTVVKRGELINYGKYKYICKCDCGNICERKMSVLNNRYVRSCGECRKLKKNEIYYNTVYNTYNNNAKTKDREFTINKEEFKVLIKKNCYYCNSKPSNTLKNNKTKEEFKYNGLDRIDSNGGYAIKNVVPCCSICNKAKLAMSLEIFLKWIKQLTNYQNTKNLIDYDAYLGK